MGYMCSYSVLGVVEPAKLLFLVLRIYYGTSAVAKYVSSS